MSAKNNRFSGEVEKAAAVLRHATSLRPTLGLILGSGFGGALARMEVVREIPFAKLPGFPNPGVAGHAGRVVVGKLGSTSLIALLGRAHFYEGHTMQQVTFPVRVLAAFGIQTLLLTNAAGAINPKYCPGDFMALSDHINFMGVNPLGGPIEFGLARFVDLSGLYDARLRRLLIQSGRKTGLKMHEGVYLAVSGPSYETPAEIRAFRRLGADAVGMSTVPEAMVARQEGLRVAALSCLTNLAAGVRRTSISHDEVLSMGRRQQDKVGGMLESFAMNYGTTE
ncbi:MAG: purine-nucleoside phosphorylase [Opitutaceae bacterium]|nr:purine-nucleoside phosphorylase [Verrucomicrobiales bacterium]